MRHSTVTERNPKAITRTEPTNLGFFAAAARALGQTGHRSEGAIGIVGGADLFSGMLRQAQALLRWDRRASYWSHAFLIAGPIAATPAAAANTPLLECTLHPRPPAVHAPERNGVTVGRLANYPETMYPNAALLSFQLSRDEITAILARARDPNLDRLRFDLWDLLSLWREYVWALGARLNPLLEGHRLFNVAYCELAYEAVGIDLTPGASERNSSPEHLWNTALWWWKPYEDTGHPIQVHAVIRQAGLPGSEALPPQISPEELAAPRGAPSADDRRRRRRAR